MSDKPNQTDLAAIEIQLQRTPRDVHGIAHRCACGSPDVVETPPRLSDDTPFPTFFYATCPKLTGAISTLESSGLIQQTQDELGTEGGRRSHSSSCANPTSNARAV